MAQAKILTCIALVVAATQAPASAETSLQRGVRLYRAGHFAEAINALISAEQQDGRNAEVHYNLGNAYLQSGETVKAVHEYELGYSLAGSGPVAAYCRSALAGVQHRNRGSFATARYRDGAYSRAGNAIRCPVGTPSHSDGVEKSKTGLTAQEWAIWKLYFDRVVRRAEMKVIPYSVHDWQNLTGICELYYYVDRNRKLRARVNRSTTQDSVNAALLEVVRNLDGSQAITFPPGINVDSFNFYHGVDLGEVSLALKMQSTTTATSASITSTGASVKATGQAASQAKLPQPSSSASTTSALRDAKITADVAGKVISNSKTELKATQQVLPPDSATQEIKGTVLDTTKTKP